MQLLALTYCFKK